MPRSASHQAFSLCDCISLLLLLGLLYQQLLEVLAGITRRPVASGVFLGFYGWLFSSESRFALLLLFRPYPYTLAVSPQFSYWVVTEGLANPLVGLPGDALAIFLGWSVAISTVWAIWAWRTSPRLAVG